MRIYPFRLQRLRRLSEIRRPETVYSEFSLCLDRLGFLGLPQLNYPLPSNLFLVCSEDDRYDLLFQDRVTDAPPYLPIVLDGRAVVLTVPHPRRFYLCSRLWSGITNHGAF